MGIFLHTNKIHYQIGFLRIIKIIIIIGLVFEISLVLFVAVYGQFDDVTYKEDAVVVLGAGIRGDRVTLPLKMRLDKAVEYFQKNKEAVIVVSGGQGFQETITEALAMESYLLNNGVPKEKILREEKATSKNENMRFSKELLDKQLEIGYKAVIITNDFHVYRSINIARIEGLNAIAHISCPHKWYNYVTCCLRESLAIIKMWVFK